MTGSFELSKQGYILQVDYYLYVKDVLQDRYTENVAWNLTKATIVTDHDYYPSDYNLSESVAYSVVKVTLDLKRKSQFYWLYILIPILILNILGIGIFVFPAGRSEKVSFGWGILLTLFVFTILVHNNIPKTSDYTPVLGKLHTPPICITVLSTRAFPVRFLSLSIATRCRHVSTWLY